MKTSIIIPANNEAHWMSACLEAVFASQMLEAAQVIVVANGCTDNTADVARRYQSLAEAKGWELLVIELTIGERHRKLGLDISQRTHATDDHAGIAVTYKLNSQTGEELNGYVFEMIRRALD